MIPTHRIAFPLLAGTLTLPAQIEAASPFALRGVVEGYYGTPWALEDRLEVLDFMARHGMNLFVYAPKDDAYQRAQWRDPYPPDALETLLAAASHAQGVGVDFGYSVSPGWGVGDQTADTSICYSCDEDLTLLLEKFEPLFEVGTRTFMLSFDDVWPLLVHTEDKRAYHSLAEAQCDLASRLEAAMQAIDPQVHLLFTPTEYDGATPSEYLETLRTRLPESIDVLWTGMTVISPTITADDAAAYGALIGRPPLIWDNYPVNDTTLVQNVHFGPVRGRAPDLYLEARGLLANPMTQPRAGRVALATIADYLEEPEAYDPEASFDAAIDEVGGSGAGDLRAFALQCRSSALTREESVTLRDAIGDLEAAFDGPWWLEPAAAVEQELEAQAEAGTRLPDSLPDARMGAEISSWLEKFRLNVTAALAAMDTLRTLRPGLENAAAERVAGELVVTGTVTAASRSDARAALGTLERLAAQVASDSHHVHGARFQYYPNFGFPEASIYWGENVVWNFLEDTRNRALEWLASHPDTGSMTLKIDALDVLVSTGPFEVHLPDGGQSGLQLVLVDGAGDQAGVEVAVTDSSRASRNVKTPGNKGRRSPATALTGPPRGPTF